SAVVPLHSRPVIQALQRQVDVFVGLQFQYRQPAFACTGQHVNHGAIRGGKSRDLGINVTLVQTRIDRRHVLRNQRFQPAFRIHAPERIAALALDAPGCNDCQYKLNEGGFGLFREPRFVSRWTKDELFFHTECSWDIRGSEPREFEPVHTKSYFRLREDSNLSLRSERQDPGNALRKARAYERSIGTAYQPGMDVALIGEIDRLRRFIALFKLKELEPCRVLVEMGHPNLHG